MNNKVFHNNSKIVRTWFALRLRELGLKALNKMIYWKIDEEIPKAWKVGHKELSIEKLVDWRSIKA